MRYRLDALGLGGLCAVVHDAQHDQRALYKKLRDTLEGLADNQTPPAATESDLQLLDLDLVRLHAELSAYHQGLHEPPVEGAFSFHELVGQWLALPDTPDDLGLDHDGVGALTLAELQSGHADLTELLERARKIRYAENPWVEAVGLSLADYLAQPIATWRQRMAAMTRAAEQIDADMPGGALPGLDADHVVPLANQAELRLWLAERLEGLAALPGLSSAATWWVSQPHEPVRQARAGFGGMDERLRQIGTAPLDPALLAAGAASSLADTNRALATLRDYEAACGHWYAGVYNPYKKPAQAILTDYGLPTDPGASGRLRSFLEGVAARTVARDFLRRTVGDGVVEATLSFPKTASSQSVALDQCRQPGHPSPQRLPTRQAIALAVHVSARASSRVRSCLRATGTAGHLKAGLDQGLVPGLQMLRRDLWAVKQRVSGLSRRNGARRAAGCCRRAGGPYRRLG